MIDAMNAAVSGWTTANSKPKGDIQCKTNFAKDDVAAGQECVKNYVEFIHYVERFYEAVKNPSESHYPEPQTASCKK